MEADEERIKAGGFAEELATQEDDESQEFLMHKCMTDWMTWELTQQSPEQRILLMGLQFTDTMQKRNVKTSLEDGE